MFFFIIVVFYVVLRNCYGRFRGRSRWLKIYFNAILLIKLPFPNTCLLRFILFYIKYKMGMFRFGIRVTGSYIYL